MSEEICCTAWRRLTATRSTTWWRSGAQERPDLRRLAASGCPAACPGWPGTLNQRRRAAFAAPGLEQWEFDVLSALRRQGPPYQLSPGALLHATLVTSGTMVDRIDRLAADGLVSRASQPAGRTRTC